MLNNSKQNILKLGLSFLTLFTLFFVIANYPERIAFELKKANVTKIFSFKDCLPKKTTLKDITSNEIISKSDSINDSIKIEIYRGISESQSNDSLYQINLTKDSAWKQRVLLIGDSQLEGLRNPVYNYCVENDCKLSATILWYGSSTKQWGQTDTLDFFINKFRPTFVLFAIGLNELFVNDLENRKTYINNILDKFKKLNVKYFWIGPAAWTIDKGVVELMQTQVGKLFYPSHLLTLARADDKRHPSRDAAKIWFDSVAVYMSKNSEIDFSKKTISNLKIQDSPMILLSQVK